MSLRIAAIPTCLMTLAAACGGGGAGEGQSADLSTLGGVVEVTEGPLAGVRLEFPPGAAQRRLPIRFTRTRALAVPGFRPLGDCIRIAPLDAAFQLPVQLTIPYDQNDQTGTEIVVLAHTLTGDVVELGPAVSPEPGRAAVAIGGFAGFWVGERMFGGLPTADFLPLDDGNEWVFDNGITARLALTFEEPNLVGEFIHRLDFEDAQADHAGLYLARDWATGAVHLRGRYAAGEGGRQFVHDAAPFVPGGVTIGRPVQCVHTAVEHEPFGGAATGTVTVSTRIVAGIPEALETTVGTFDDLIDIAIDTRLQRTDGTVVEVPMTLRLARYVGPVALRIGDRWARVVAGTVGGVPL